MLYVWRYDLGGCNKHNLGIRIFVTSLASSFVLRGRFKGKEDEQESYLADTDVVTVSAAQFHLNSVH